MSNRAWHQWRETTYDADADTTSFEHGMDAEDVDDMDDDIAQKRESGCRTKLWQNIYEDMNIRSETNHTRLDGLHKSIAWADLMIRFCYYKAQSAIRRTKKNVSRSFSPTINYDHPTQNAYQHLQRRVLQEARQGSPPSL